MSDKWPVGNWLSLTFQLMFFMLDYNLRIRAYFYGFVADLLWQLLIFDVDLQTNRKETELAIRQKTQRRI